MILQEINDNRQNCMDGRPTVAFAHVIRNRVSLLQIGGEAAGLVNMALPGAGLGPIAYLEKHIHIRQMDAIIAVETAFRQLGLVPTFHIDNHHGEYEITVPETGDVHEASLIQLIQTTLTGCGFAGLTWREQANGVLEILRGRGWIIQVLDGIHSETRALRVNRPGYSVHHPSAHAAGESAFVLNVPETEKLFSTLHGVLKFVQTDAVLGDQRTFTTQAMLWVNEQFAAIAKKLRNIDTPEDIG